MAVTKVLARSWTKEIYVTDAFVDINGINAFSVASTKQETDITDFESAGWGEYLIAARSNNITLEGFWLEDEGTGARDPGQAAVEASAQLFGASGLAQYRLTSPGGKTMTFYASAEVEGPGGDHNAAASWKVNLHVAGAIVYA